MSEAREYTGEPEWRHPTAPIWIVYYPTTEARVEHWQGYRAVAHVPAGRDPSTVDNRRIGSERGFASFEAALAACEQAASYA